MNLHFHEAGQSTALIVWFLRLPMKHHNWLVLAKSSVAGRLTDSSLTQDNHFFYSYINVRGTVYNIL